MARITEIYERYKIMPVLQLHQLRVAAVAQIICQHFKADVDKPTIITACLLHDMGNILKFDLTRFPNFLEPQGLEYWESVKTEFEEKYKTKKSHDTSHKIAQELGVSGPALDLIDQIGFSQIKNNRDTKHLEPKICAYADMRVDPMGIVSLGERIKDLHVRYADWPGHNSDEQKQADDALREIERQVFALIGIKPESITDKTAAPIIEQLKSYEI